MRGLKLSIRQRVIFRQLLSLLPVLCALISLTTSARAVPAETEVGVAETEITPPTGFPMAGYFHERLCEGTTDPLLAKAIVFRSGSDQAAIVVCDLIGITTDFSRIVRRRASEKTGIPYSNIAVSATHSHTAPDYNKSLYGWLLSQDPSAVGASLTGVEQSPERLAYIGRLIDGTVDAIVRAHASLAPARLHSGWAEQQTPVAFNRRFVQKDGSVRTWVGLEYAGTVRSAGPIDPEIPLLDVRHPDGRPRAVFSNFALHLDTVGGTKWSADYPVFISSVIRESLGSEVISIFGTGCCGDINHVNPRGGMRNTTDVIGKSVGSTIVAALPTLTPIEKPVLAVRSTEVRLPLQPADAEAVSRSISVLRDVADGKPVEFLDHVTAHKTVMLDQLRNSPRLVPDSDGLLARRVTQGLAGIGSELPVDLQVICLGRDLAIVCLPGEVFVELGLAIKRASPCRQTMILELTNCVETFYVPTRAAFAGGGYEPTNSTIAHGGGELLVEETIRLLQSAAEELGE
jgi:hypothetical protein